MRTNHSTTVALMIGLVMLLSASAAIAQPAGAAGAPGGPVGAAGMGGTPPWAAALSQAESSGAAAQRAPGVTRVYDIADLLQQMREPAPTTLLPPTQIGKADEPVRVVHDAAPGFGGGPPSAYVPSMSALRPTPSDPAAALGNTIGRTFNAAAYVYGNKLIVTAPEETQRQIADLLGQLRAESSRLVQVEAHWLLLTPAELSSILRASDAQQAATQPLREVDAQALASKLGPDIVHYRATITCFSGQFVRLSSGPARTVIVHSIPVVAASAVAYQQESETVQCGALLNVRPTIAPTSAAILDLQSTISYWNAPPAAGNVSPTASTTQRVPVAGGSGGVDRVDVLVQQLDTTLRVPLGRLVLVGGMTLDPAADAARADRQMYLMVSASVGQ